MGHCHTRAHLALGALLSPRAPCVGTVPLASPPGLARSRRSSWRSSPRMRRAAASSALCGTRWAPDVTAVHRACGINGCSHRWRASPSFAARAALTSASSWRAALTLCCEVCADGSARPCRRLLGWGRASRFVAEQPTHLFGFDDFPRGAWLALAPLRCRSCAKMRERLRAVSLLL